MTFELPFYSDVNSRLSGFTSFESLFGQLDGWVCPGRCPEIFAGHIVDVYIRIGIVEESRGNDLTVNLEMRVAVVGDRGGRE